MGLRTLLTRALRGRSALKAFGPAKMQRFGHHDDGPPQPFDNMPFSVPNRYVVTVFFSVFFGLGLWAPFVIVWYQMAKKSL